LISVLVQANEPIQSIIMQPARPSMLRKTLFSLWAWLARRLSDPLAIPAFVLAFAAGGAATFLLLSKSALLGLIFALVGVPVLFGLMSLVPRVGGALSLGGNVGGAAVLAVLFMS